MDVTEATDMLILTAKDMRIGLTCQAVQVSGIDTAGDVYHPTEKNVRCPYRGPQDMAWTAGAIGCSTVSLRKHRTPLMFMVVHRRSDRLGVRRFSKTHKLWEAEITQASNYQMGRGLTSVRCTAPSPMIHPSFLTAVEEGASSDELLQAVHRRLPARHRAPVHDGTRRLYAAARYLLRNGQTVAFGPSRRFTELSAPFQMTKKWPFRQYCNNSGQKHVTDGPIIAHLLKSKSQKISVRCKAKE